MTSTQMCSYWALWPEYSSRLPYGFDTNDQRSSSLILVYFVSGPEQYRSRTALLKCLQMQRHKIKVDYKRIRPVIIKVNHICHILLICINLMAQDENKYIHYHWDYNGHFQHKYGFWESTFRYGRLDFKDEAGRLLLPKRLNM